MVDLKKIRDSAIEKLKKSGYDRVSVSGFSFCGRENKNTMEETLVLKRGNRGYMASVIYKFDTRSDSLKSVTPEIILPYADKTTAKKVKKDIIDAFQK